MDAIYQLWGLSEENTDWDCLLRKLDRLMELHPAKAVVCGLFAPEEVYHRIRERAGKEGAAVYLWLPAFSELDDTATFDPLIDWQGEDYLEGRKIREFHFRCPGSVHNREIFFAEALGHLKAEKFDGVFLDRIRFPSFQFGLPGVLGCFCPHCVKRYEAMGLDPERLRAACGRLQKRISAKEINPLGLKAFDGHQWQLEDPDLQALMEARCTILEESLGWLCTAFRERGYRIGLDLFSPALSWFAGQDFQQLMKLADFVKPMMYLHTTAPAGLPYELDAVERAAGGKSKETLMKLSGGETMEAFASAEIRRMRTAA